MSFKPKERKKKRKEKEESVFFKIC